MIALLAALSFVAQCNAATTTCTVPTHVAADLMVACAYRASNTAATIGSGWTSIFTAQVGSTSSVTCACRTATGTTSTTDPAGTWTNAAGLAISIYRGQKNTTTCTSNIGGVSTFAGGNTGATTTLRYTFVPKMTDPGGNSWVIGFAGQTSGTTLATNGTPAGMTLRSTSSTNVVLSDTNGGKVGWNDAAVTVSSATRWQSVTIEILAPVIANRAAGGTPTMVQHLAHNAEPTSGEAGNNFNLTLPNLVQAGNCLVLGMTYDQAHVLRSVSDTVNSTWPAAAVNADDGTGTGQVRQSIVVFPNAGAGLTKITVTFEATTLGTSFVVSEFNNCATTNALDVVSVIGGVTGPTVATAAMTTTQDGDLIWQYASQNGAAFGHALTSPYWVPGASFTPLELNIAWSWATSGIGLDHATQYQVQGTHGAITPTITATQAVHDTFTSTAVAIRPASSGAAAPTSGIYINRLHHFTTDVFPASPWVLQFPCKGNLLVCASAGDIGTGLHITSITDSNSNTWALANATSGVPEIWYAANATCSNDLVMSFNFTGTPPTETFLCWDASGADPNPLDATVVTCPGQSCAATPPADINDQPDFTPTFPGLEIVAFAAGQGPYSQLAAGAPANAVFDPIYYSTGPQTDGSLFDNSDGYGHVYDTGTATRTWNWHLQGTAGGSSGYSATLAHFKSLVTGPIADTTACTTPDIRNCPHGTGTTATSLTTASFSTGQSVELICAMTAQQGVGNTATALSDSGLSLSIAWTKIGNCSNGTTNDSEIWCAVTNAAASSKTVTATFTATSVASSTLTVVPFATSQTTLPTNYICGTGASGAASLSITTAANSIALLSGADNSSTTARTATTNATVVNGQAGATGYAWGEFTQTLSLGANTIGTTAPTSTKWGLDAIEVALAGTASVKPRRTTMGVGAWLMPWEVHTNAGVKP